MGMVAEARPSPRPPSEFRVDLEIYRGPLDLLLYLVRKNEVDIQELPIAPITEQFKAYLDVLQAIDFDQAGEFVVVATQLMEIKSRLALPRPPDAPAEESDPRRELVQQLLEYKKFKDAASLLEDRARAWQERFPRLANDLPARERELADEPIRDLEIWDLVSAFSRLMRDREALRPANIVYDETPIHVYMQRIHGQLVSRGRMAFSELFAGGMHKSSLVSIFLAMMELVRHHGARAEQENLFGEIWLFPGVEQPLEAMQADEYAGGDAKS